MGLSLEIGSLDRLSPEDQKRQIVELFHKLETYLNSRVTAHIKLSTKDQSPKYNKGDILLDFTANSKYVQLYVWNGKKLLPVPTARSFQPLSNGQIPTPEIIFDEVTGEVKMTEIFV